MGKKSKRLKKSNIPKKSKRTKKIKKSKRKSKRKSKKRNTREPYIYCGNNSLHPDVVNGNAIIGTKFRCLKKGYGAGFYGEIDLNFLNDYEPIDRRKIYCGNRQEVPEGYDRQGNLPSCFQKGFATGKKERAVNGI